MTKQILVAVIVFLVPSFRVLAQEVKGITPPDFSSWREIGKRPLSLDLVIGQQTIRDINVGTMISFEKYLEHGKVLKGSELVLPFAMHTPVYKEWDEVEGRHYLALLTRHGWLVAPPGSNMDVQIRVTGTVQEGFVLRKMTIFLYLPGQKKAWRSEVFADPSLKDIPNEQPSSPKSNSL